MSLRRFLPVLMTGGILAAASPTVSSSVFKSPAWLSIESPVNPYDPATRGAVVLVHTHLVAGSVQPGDLSGSAEGLVNGARRSIPLHFDSVARPNTYGIRRQWPNEGTWLLRITLEETTALVTFDANGTAAARIPMRATNDIALPRAVGARDVDSALAAAAKP
jgi:hypothetical protein